MNMAMAMRKISPTLRREMTQMASEMNKRDDSSKYHV